MIQIAIQNVNVTQSQPTKDERNVFSLIFNTLLYINLFYVHIYVNKKPQERTWQAM